MLLIVYMYLCSADVNNKFIKADVSGIGSTTSQRCRRVQAFRLVLLDGLEEVGVRVEALPLVLPVVAGRYEEAAVLRQHRLHPSQARQEVRHLEAHRLQAASATAGGKEM